MKAKHAIVLLEIYRILGYTRSSSAKGNRVLAARVVVTAVLVCLALPGTGWGASGSQTDPQDQFSLGAPPSATPVDVKSISVNYNPEAGSITSRFELYGDARQRFPGFTLALGKKTPTGDCEVPYFNYYDYEIVGGSTGDPILRFGYSPELQTYDTLQVKGAGDQLSGSGTVTVGADGTTVDYAITNSALVRRAYECVGSVYAEGRIGYINSLDEVASFCFDGPCVPPPAADKTPPSVRWVSPKADETISGIYTENSRGLSGVHNCLVEAADSGSGIDRTQNFVDGQPLDEQITRPYACEWDTRTVPDGVHFLRVRAFDRAGNFKDAQIKVQVKNASAVPVSPPVPPAPPAPSVPPAPPVLPTPAPPAASTVSGSSGAGTAALVTPPVVIFNVPGSPSVQQVTPPAATTPPATTTPSRLTTSTAAKRLSGALRARFGRAFTARRSYRRTCRVSSPTRVSCKVSWRYKKSAYRGTVTVSRTAGGRFLTRVSVRSSMR